MPGKELKLNQPEVPGIGVGGVVMCPFFKGPCLKGGCELWVGLKQGDNWVARCTLSWMTVLAIETRQSIDKITAPMKAPLQKKGRK